MSTPSYELPAQISPLAAKGRSLDVRTVTCSGGILTNIDEYLRPKNKAARIRNVHQFSRGVFSSGGGGWKRDAAAGLNGNAASLDFGVYIDALGNQYLLEQVGNTAYNYDTVGHLATALGAPLNALSATALPCMRPSAPTGTSSNPFTVYCNGLIEPQKIYNATAGAAPNTVAALGFDTGLKTELCTVGGTMVIGNQLAIVMTSIGFARSPLPIVYTIIAGDTNATAAAGLVNAINNDTTASQAGVTATASGATITISYPSALVVTFASGLNYETATITGTFGAGKTARVTASLPNSTETATAGGTVVVGNVFTVTFTAAGIANGKRVVSFTATTTAVNDVATGLNAVINADKTLAAAGIFSTVAAPVVTINYPTALGVAFAATAEAAATLVMAAGSVGTTVNATYTEVAGDDATKTAAGLAAVINSQIDYIYSGINATSSGAVVTIPYPSTLSPAWAGLGGGGTVVTVAAANPANPSTLTFVAGPTTAVWPGVFDGLTYTKPALCAPFMSRMAYIGFSNGGADGNKVACNILISSLGNAEKFIQSVPAQATDAWSDTIPAILGLPTAITSFRPLTNVASEILVIGCQNGMAVVTGTDASSFNLQIQTTQFGIPSNRTFVQVDNTLLFMATDGFRAYSGSNNVSNLLTDSLSLDIYDQFLNIDKAQWQKSHAIHHRDTQEIWFWVPYGEQSGSGSAGAPPDSCGTVAGVENISQLAISNDNAFLFALAFDTNTTLGAVFKIRISDWTVVAEQDFSGVALTPTSFGRCPMALSADGSKLYFAYAKSSAIKIAGVNTSDLTVINSVAAAGINNPNTHSFALSPDGGTIAWMSGNTLVKMDTTTFVFDSTVIVSGAASGVFSQPMVWADNSHVYILDGAQLSLADTTTGVIGSGVPLLPAPIPGDIASNGSLGAITRNGAQVVITYPNDTDPTAAGYIDTVDTGTGATTRLTVGIAGANDVNFANFIPAVILSAVATGASLPEGFAFNPAIGTGEIYTFTLPPTGVTTKSVVSCVGTPAQGYAVAGDGSRIYVAGNDIDGNAIIGSMAGPNASGAIVAGDNGFPAHAFIYNYNTIDGPPIWYLADNTICTASIEFKGTFYGGNDIGLVQKWYGCDSYDDSSSGFIAAQNIVPGAEIVLPILGVGNPAQLCSIQHTVIGTSSKDQKFLMNAATYELMDDGSTRKQQQQPINYLVQSLSPPQTVLGPASPTQWELNISAFPSLFSKFLDGFVPLGHGRCWEFSLLCNDHSHNFDFTFLQATISIGGQRV